MASNLYKVQERNIWKTWSLMTGFLVILVLIGWILSYVYGDVNILYVFLVISLVMNFASYWFSDKIVLNISGAKEAKKEQYYDLYTVTENLCISAGLPMPKIYVINDPSPNAFATGRNPKNSAVAVTTGLLNILERSELEGVIAHELSHIQNRDILLQSVIVVLVGLITLVSDFFLRTLFWKGGDKDNKGNIWIFVIGIILMILAPIVAAVIQFSISRKREFLADSTGALMTRYPEGLASALEKISKYPVTLKRANHATAHLYISDPFTKELKDQKKKKEVGFFHRLFLTHPPMEERIEALIGKGTVVKD